MSNQLSQTLSVVFIGEGSLLLNCAKIFLERGHSIVGIISNDIKIKNWCVSARIDYTSHKEYINFLESKLFTASIDILFSIVNDSIIPETILSKPTFAAINYHNSLLPTYAGINATTWAIYNQETAHGVSWHRMNSTIDSGELFKQKLIRINQTETAFTLNGKCYEAALESFQELIHDIENKQATITKQDLNFRSYFGRYKKPTPAGIINFAESGLKISALVRSLYFDIYPNEITTPKIIIGGIPYIVGNLSVTNHKSQLQPGSLINVTNDHIEVATLDNNICITKLFDIQGKPANITQMSIDNLLQKGDIINNLSSELLNQVSAVEQNIAKHEQYWVKQFENLNQIQLPYMKNLSTESGYHTMELLLPLTSLGANTKLEAIESDKFLLGITILFASKLSNSIDFGLSYSDPEIKDLAHFGQLFSTSLQLI